MHSCDNPSCVNPDHLQQGTQLENILDSINKGRFRKTNINKFDYDKHIEDTERKNWSEKITKDKANDIKIIYSSGSFTQKEIGKLYGLSTSQISRIIKKESWRN